MNAEGSSISQGVSFARERSIGSFVSSRERARARTASQSALFASGLVGHSFINILENIGWSHVKSIAKTINHAKAWTAFTEFDKRNVVAVNSGTQGQIGLAPFAFCSQAAKCMPECLIYIQGGCPIS